MRDPDDYLRVCDLARDCRVGSKSVRDWLRRRKLNRKPYYYLSGRHSFVRADTAARYAAEREHRRPPGWVPIKTLVAELGGMGRTYLARLEAANRIRVKNYRGNYYVHPDDARWAVQNYRTDYPAPGMVATTTLADELGRHRTAPAHWARRNDAPLHVRRNPATGVRAAYLDPYDAERYRQLTRQNGGRNKPVRYLEAA